MGAARAGSEVRDTLRAREHQHQGQPRIRIMGKKIYTIIVVPHAKAKFRKVRVPYTLFMAAGVAVVLVVLGIAGLSYRFANVQLNKDELAKMRKENLELRKENEKTRQVTEDLRGKLGGFQETVSRFKVLFGVGG